ncbi:AlpA family phage regulatory protein [Enterobacter sp. JBIWA005]|uniref:helix-turn-helix transcriptional regulator n=1 Tax=Enterobacter sp. JBIWA005 TaxID=2831891 RepID=UPI001CBF4F68|nr:AlpA family phage regulatory protein [Enterobacter sp. JBIWA005]UAN30804.1 AlpA family phage regulatory protein [Enterobacter sp. JBIWA005]
MTSKQAAHLATAHLAIPATGYIRRFRMPELLGVSMPTIDRWAKNGTMPRPVKLSDNVTAFDAVEINNWLAERRGKVA